jgi:hypothetical protein
MQPKKQAPAQEQQDEYSAGDQEWKTLSSKRLDKRQYLCPLSHDIVLLNRIRLHPSSDVQDILANDWYANTFWILVARACFEPPMHGCGMGAA